MQQPSWKECADHVRSGGVVEVMLGERWVDDQRSADDYESWSRRPSDNMLFLARRLVPIEAPGFDTGAQDHSIDAFTGRVETLTAASEAPSGALQRYYVASKTEHADMWKAMRAEGAPIISTWLDEAGVGETGDFTDLWQRCVAEVRSCDRLVAYHSDGDVWKGAFVEIGAALAAGIPVSVVGDPPGSWLAHPLVTRSASVRQACGLPELPMWACSGSPVTVNVPDDYEVVVLPRGVVAELADSSWESDLEKEVILACVRTVACRQPATERIPWGEALVGRSVPGHDQPVDYIRRTPDGIRHYGSLLGYGKWGRTVPTDGTDGTVEVSV